MCLRQEIMIDVIQMQFMKLSATGVVSNIQTINLQKKREAIPSKILNGV